MSLDDSLTKLDWLQMLNGGGVINQVQSADDDSEMESVNLEPSPSQVCLPKKEENPLQNLSNEELIQHLKDKADFVDPSTPEKVIKPNKTYENESCEKWAAKSNTGSFQVF